jgi:hypothetical protein
MLNPGRDSEPVAAVLFTGVARALPQQVVDRWLRD